MPVFLFFSRESRTLMGHGYVELRNTGAAIEAYRKAVDKDSRDHNAWYVTGGHTINRRAFTHRFKEGMEQRTDIYTQSTTNGRA